MASAPPRSLLRTFVRWAWIAFFVHSAVLVLLAPSAFMYDGEGFVLSGPAASRWQRVMDGPVRDVVYDVVNYRLSRGAHDWVFAHSTSLDEATLWYCIPSYLVIGGAFYALLGGVAGLTATFVRRLRRRSGYAASTARL
jgi:hypothetical protein